MYDAVSRSELQRARGNLLVAVRLRDGCSVLSELRQEGSLKARFPRPVDWTEVVTLNTSGGVVGGDELASAVSVDAGASLTVASQAAERFYRALPNSRPARVATTLDVASGASLEWLPQETILFDRCAMVRTLTVDLAPDAWFLGVESLVFGRAAMGEDVATARISDTIRIRRAGALVLHDAIRFDGPVASLLARPAVAAGARAVATLVHVAPDAEGRIDALREALVPFEAGVSGWNGLLLARILAPAGAALRVAVCAGLQCLRGGRSLPRVWMC